MAKYNKSELYFFKFPDDFFERDEIEEILTDYDGDSTVLLYLRLILLAVNKMGYLARIIDGELKPYRLEDLYRKTCTDEDDFKRRVKRLTEVGLIELKDNILFIEDALKYTNQTVGAFKKELQRKDEDINCPPNCPPEEEVRNQNLESRTQNLDGRNNNYNSYSSEQQREGENTHPALQDIISRVINYLNAKTYRNFKPTTKKTIGHFKYLLSKGYKEEDFITVIDKMCECWLGNGKLEDYLRPDTLFGQNFEGYLTEDWDRNETDWQSRYDDY